MKAEQLLGAASRLFNAGGLDGVRLDDVSDAVGATKGAIYHHFKDKSELIERAYDRAFDIYDHIMQLGASLPRSTLERAIVVTHLNAQAQLCPLPPLALQPGFVRLTDEKQRELTLRARRLDQVSVGILGAGVADGSCRALNMTFAPQIKTGQFLGLARHALTHCPPSVMADFLTNGLAFGLRRRKNQP